MEALHVGKPPPDELLDFILCRDVYRCSPDVLDVQDAERVMSHLTVMAAEAKVINANRR